jgi:hypothetical protein
MNNAVSVDKSLWVDKASDCTLTGGLSSPYFIPKVSEVALKYDTLLSRSSGVFLFENTLVEFSFLPFLFFFFLFYFAVTIRGKLLIACGLRVEGRLGSRDNEVYRVLEIEEWSGEEEAVVMWPEEYESEKEVDWYLRILHGEDFKQVCRCIALVGVDVM